MKQLYGLIGCPLGHSLSADYFTRKFAAMSELDGCAYELFELESADELRQLLTAHPNLRGLNVTIPHKRAVIPLLDRISSEAERIGAVNSIKVEADGTLTGHNTDYIGFGASLTDFLLGATPRALVLGTGGASRAVCTWLADHGIEYQRVSHSGQGELSYDDLTPEVVESHKLIINATPLGMSPRVDESPLLPYDSIGAEHYLFDLIYNPNPTKFLMLGARRGARVMGGMEMFRLQAEASWAIWSGDSDR